MDNKLSDSRRGTLIPDAESEKVPEDEDLSDHEEAPPTSSLETEDSDFFPSVALAGLLFLVFLLVIPVLFPPHHSLKNHSISINGTLVQLPPLLASQPQPTQWALHKIFRITNAEGFTVITVAEDDALHTIVCFSSYLLSLLSQKSSASNVTKSLQYSKPRDFSWKSSRTEKTKGFYISVITQKSGQAPYGLILGPEVFTGGIRKQWEMILTASQMDNRMSLYREASEISTEVLQNLLRKGQLEQWELWVNQFPILQIAADPYLESGFVC
ncbi:hypothetical protein GDO86_014834 [Hymenochirus boettgeri]|uniref:Uncharacterized protein n=1 Tax=Hymenochirus boettgeri TaxID=247094 RepID=A0A8T2JQA7_9PIPI|nr:hypothetical protein GDO86_014834 [Hymenochirus boettgeri]